MSTVADSASLKVESSPGNSQVWCTMTSVVDTDALTPEQTIQWLNESLVPVEPEPTAFYKDVELLLRAVLQREYKRLCSKNRYCHPVHLSRYIEWIRWRLGDQHMSSKEGITGELVDELEAHVRRQGAIGLIFSEVCRNLEGLLQGLVDPIQLLFDNGLVKGYYKERSESSQCFAKLQTYLRATTLKHPQLRIMEVGAGTGTFTSIVLEALSMRDENGIQAKMFEHYRFIDISPAFFESARTMFAHYGKKLSFGTFDIESDYDGAEQPGGLFDIFIAANVLHVSKDLRASLRNVRKALKSGGIWILLETTTP